jgi:hypothetical protein
MNKFDKLYESLLIEKSINTPQDSSYKKLIKDVNNLPWDGKIKKSSQSAVNEIYGTINGKEVDFSWAQPSTEWGPLWQFHGMLVDGKEMFDDTMDDFGEINVGDRPIDWINWVKKGQPGLDKNLIKRDLDNFKKAISYAKGL